jgi:hypothetical protein
VNRSVARSTALALITLVLAPTAANADHEGIHPAFRSERVYFHCNGQTKLYQANWFASAGAQSSHVPWSTAQPPGSVTDGNGCGGGDAGWVTNPVYDVAFQGTFTGNLRDMTVHLHEFIVGNTRESETQEMRVYAEIDGVPLFPVGAIEGGFEGRAFTARPVSANSGATHAYEFTITNVGFANEVLDENGDVVDVETGGAALEDGDGEIEHTLLLMVGIDSFPGESPPTGSTMWVWDTTEVPSGIEFNPSAPAVSKVKADLPDLR